MSVATQLEQDQRTGREIQALVQLTERLHRTFPDVAERDLEATVEQAYHRFDDSRIRDFVPIFVERNVRATLADGAS